MRPKRQQKHKRPHHSQLYGLVDSFCLVNTNRFVQRESLAHLDSRAIIGPYQPYSDASTHTYDD